MLKKNTSGFTLIEITLVLAITSAMVVIIFSGSQASRGRSQFNATIDDVITNLQTIKANVASSSDTDSLSAGTNLNTFKFGYLIEFRGNGGGGRDNTTYQVTPLYGVCSADGISVADCATVSCQMQQANDQVSTSPVNFTSFALPSTMDITSSNTLSSSKKYLFLGYDSQNADDTYIIIYHNLCSNALSLVSYTVPALPPLADLEKMSNYPMTVNSSPNTSYDTNILLSSKANSYKGKIYIKGSENIGFVGSLTN